MQAGLYYIPVYLPYKVYLLLATLRVIRINITVLHVFIIISFLNRCLNPFIYASQYEEIRRTPVIEFLRAHIVRIRQLALAAAAAAATRVGPVPASLPSHPPDCSKAAHVHTESRRQQNRFALRQSPMFIDVKPRVNE